MWKDCLTQEVEEDAAEQTADNLSTVGQVEFCEQVEQDDQAFHNEEPTVDDQVLTDLVVI